MPFVSHRNAKSFLQEFCNRKVTQSAIEALVSLEVLPQFKHCDELWFHSQDLLELSPVILSLSTAGGIERGRDNLFEFGSLTKLSIGPQTALRFTRNSARGDCTFPAAVRNLTQFIRVAKSQSCETPLFVDYVAETKIETTDYAVAEFAKLQVESIANATALRASQFANTAYYMGSKRSLSGFLFETVNGIASPETTIVDLMCGSGAASASFCQQWRTLASDAQRFCRILAEVQGQGFNADHAEKVIDFLLPKIRYHAKLLREKVGHFIDWEDQVFHGDMKRDGLEEYRRLVDLYPAYPEKKAIFGWDPNHEVELRKGSHDHLPFCLFSAYFANLYFGVRQCVEIDSIRYAISLLSNSKDRRWCLGALIAAVSCTGTTYGGHFAQPPIKNSSDITLGNIQKIVERRAASVVHEFAIRLVSLAKESGKCLNKIETVDGPWQAALEECDNRVSDCNVIVYVDAPYKREEYSRYYHVLETLVDYSYPSATGTGKVPDKSLGERFRSEFFRRNRVQVEMAFVELIGEVVRRGWTCVWSYSDNGDANIVSVCESVLSSTNCELSTRAARYEHKSQGGRRAKSVTEYLLIFRPKT